MRNFEDLTEELPTHQLDQVLAAQRTATKVMESVPGYSHSTTKDEYTRTYKWIGDRLDIEQVRPCVHLRNAPSQIGIVNHSMSGNRALCGQCAGELFTEVGPEYAKSTDCDLCGGYSKTFHEDVFRIISSVPNGVIQLLVTFNACPHCHAEFVGVSSE